MNKLSLLTCLIIAATPFALAPSAPSPLPTLETEDPFSRFGLPGGTRLMVLQVSDAPRQSTFTFLPLGLLHDDSGRAQYSHLVEHMLIRGTDPDNLSAPGMTFNGETTGDALRVETNATLEQWEASLDRHLEWLELEAVSAEVLEREKGRIAQEEASTVENGFTHKWAEAAWNQVVRHGRSHAAVHADVEHATPKELFEYAKQHLGQLNTVLIASVGPIDPEAIRAKLAQALSGRTAEAPSARALEASNKKLSGGATSTATWDLDAHHMVQWMELRDLDARDRVAGHVLVQLLNMELAKPGEFELGHLLTSTASVSEGRYLMFSASLLKPEDADRARVVFESALDRVLAGKSFPIPLALTQLRAQAGQNVDPAPARKQLERMGRDTTLIEVQLLLSAVMNELRLGLNYEEIQAAWEALDLEQMESYLEHVRTEVKVSSLVLSPK